MFFSSSLKLKPKFDRNIISVVADGQRRKRRGVGDSALRREIQRQVAAGLYQTHAGNGAVTPDGESHDGGRRHADARIDIAGAPMLGDLLAQNIHVVSVPVAKRRALADTDAA